MADRVRAIKIENPSTGGVEEDEFYTPADPNEDRLDINGVILQNTTSSDTAVEIYRDSSNNLVFKDGVAGTKTLDDLGGGSGITSTQHRTLRQLIHFIDEGPAEGFATNAYKETLTAGPFPTSFIWWTSSAKTEKIVEETITYNSNKTINTDQWKMYDLDGTTLIATVTDTYTYSGIFESSRTRTIA
jgi:hypothetical protein